MPRILPRTALLDYIRTPIGAFMGQFASVSSTELAQACVKALIDKHDNVDGRTQQLLLGQVLPAAQGQHPAKQVAHNTFQNQPANTLNINKVCGSGMMAVALGHDALKHATKDTLILAGGTENMSLAPYCLPRSHPPKHLQLPQLVDHMMHDGLTSFGQLMGVIAQENDLGFDRQAQDDYAIQSYQRYLASQSHPLFDQHMTGVDVGTHNVREDECPKAFDEARLKRMHPAFAKNGRITAGNASALGDGAAMLLLGSATHTNLNKVKAWLLDYACVSTTPASFMLAPSQAITRLLHNIGWQQHDVDLFEINEAFAVTVLQNCQKLDLPLSCVNVFGGACTVGHPLGMSGARILGQLYQALVSKNKSRGVAAICIGGGEAIAFAMEVEQA